MRHLIALGMTACLALAAPSRASPDQQVIVHEPAVDALVTRFMESLKAGKVDGVVENLLSSSPLWQNKTLEMQNMRTQMTGAVQAYGPIDGFELIESRRLGTSVIRQYYLVRHAKMVTRWEFDLARTSGGWAVTYFGFDDQVRSWF